MKLNLKLSLLARKLVPLNQGKILTIDIQGNASVQNPPEPIEEVPAGSIIYFARPTAPNGYLKANGAAVSLTTYPNLINVYCGDSANATALFGYRCTNASNPNGSRSTSGTLIVVPDLRGEFLRVLDDGRGVDTNRIFGTAQAHDYASHTHGVTDPTHAHSISDPGHAHTQSASGRDNGAHGYGGDYDASCSNPISQRQASYGTSNATCGIGIYGAYTGISVVATGGVETRPRNMSLLACIKY